LSGLGRENTTLGFRKTRPLTGSGLLEEAVPTALLLREPCGPAWLQTLQRSFCEALMLDRHFLSDIESCVCVGAVQDWEDSRSPVDGLKLVLAQQFDNALNFRELPCSLSRLYFSGRLRFRRFVRQLKPAQLAECLRLVQLDQFVVAVDDDDPTIVEGMDEDFSAYCSPAYEAQCRQVEAYWQQVLDVLFRSFESTVLALMERAALNRPFLSVGLVDALHCDEYWRDLPPCDAPLGDQWIYLALVWRINASLALERVLQPWESDECREWLQYRLKLFRASHLDLLTAMVRANCYGDQALQQRGLLAENWPAAHRVCCAEEMPDFICYATDNFKTGTNLKERNTRDDKFGHLFVNKTSPNICKIRNMFDITIRYGEEDPVIYEAMKNILRCVLLGHLPRARGWLSCMAQIKINAFFAADEADRELSEAQWVELTRNKSLKRKKSGEAELKFRKTHFKLWFLLLRHFVLFLLKEWLLYIAESSGYFDEICNTTYKWPRGKELIRMGTGSCRQLLARQTARDTPFDWSLIEFEEKSQQTQKQQQQTANKEERAYDIKSGEIKKYHHWLLKMASKIKKDDFAKILLKKMTGTEKHVTQAQLECEFFLAAPGEAGKMTPDEFDLICWYMSLNKTPVLETRWFQVMGLSAYALAKLRSWQFLYYVYDVPDNSFNEPICEMRDRSMRDYFLLKTTLRKIEYFRNKQYVYHLPLDYAKQQTWAMRQMLNLADHERTPEHLGIVYQCRGCMRFANSVVLIDPPLQLKAPPPPTQATPAKTTKAATKAKAKTPTASKSAPKGKQPASKEAQQQAVVVVQQSHSFMCKTFYNVENGEKYCMKKQNPFTRVQELGLERPMTQVMRKLDGAITINTNKAVEVHQSAAAVRLCAPQQSFLFNDRNLREQATRKLEWLMLTSAHEMLGGAQDDDEPPQSSEAVAQDGAAPAKKGAGGKKKDGIKKLIQQRIDAVIVREGHDCQSPLMRVNIVGIMKNGKVACMKCGLMTELTNRNMTSDGSVTCGRHKAPEVPPDRTHCKYQMHARDVAPQGRPCFFCHTAGARMRVPVQDDALALRKLQLCKDCFDVFRASARAEVASLRQLAQRLAK
jgi:hypothetical protein